MHAIPVQVFDFVSTGKCFVGVCAVLIRCAQVWQLQLQPYARVLMTWMLQLSGCAEAMLRPTCQIAKNHRDHIINRKGHMVVGDFFFDPSMLVASIARFREMKHSSMTCEQAHAAGSVYMK